MILVSPGRYSFVMMSGGGGRTVEDICQGLDELGRQVTANRLKNKKVKYPTL